MERKQVANSGKSTSAAPGSDNEQSASQRCPSMTSAKEAADGQRQSYKIFVRSSVPLSKYEIYFYFFIWGVVAALIVLYCAMLSWGKCNGFLNNFVRSSCIAHP
jgi:hypothetical protein